MQTSPPTLETLVDAARGGDRDALAQVLREIRDPVYHLALRMRVDPTQAEDATQDILVLVLTRLSTYAGRSAFMTWVYRVAANHLLDVKRAQARQSALTFEAFEADLLDGLVDDAQRSPDDALMLNELRVSCTMAMLLCLTLEQRLTYVLGDVLGLDQKAACEILDIPPDRYRKRLSRARAEVVAFTGRACGLASDEARCSCPRRLPAAVAKGRVDPKGSMSASGPGYDQVLEHARRLEGDLRVLSLQQATPAFRCPAKLGRHILTLVDPTASLPH